MSTTPHNVLQLARQGKPDAIAALMNQHLQARGITAQVTQQGDALHVFLESAQALSQQELVAYVQKGITGLSLADVRQLNVSGRQAGHSAADWTKTIDFNSAPAAPAAASTNGTVSQPPGPDFKGLELESDLASDTSALSSADADLDLDLGDFEPVSQADELDLDLDNLGSDDGNDLLDLDLDSSEIDSSGTGLTDLGLTDSSAASAEDLDFDLESDALQETADELDAALSDLDMLAADDPDNSWTDSDLTSDDLDLSLDSDLDLAQAEAADTSLDDSDLNLDDSLDSELASLDLDSNELDLDFADPEPDPANQTLNLDTSAVEDSGSPDLDMALDAASADLDALDFDGTEQATDSADLDFNLEAPDTPAVADDLDLDTPPAPVDDSLDLDLDLDLDTPAAAADDLDLDFDAPSSSDESDASDASFELNFDLAESSSVAAGAELDLDVEDLADTDGDAELDLDFETGPDPDSMDSLAADGDLELAKSLEFDVADVADSTDPLDLEEAPNLDGVDAAEIDDGNLAAAESLGSDGAEVSPAALSLGEELEDDLWDSDTNNAEEPVAPSAAFPTNDIDWETSDLDWAVEDSGADAPGPDQDLAEVDTSSADIDWNSTELTDSHADLDLEAEIPPLEEGDTAPELDLSEIGASEPNVQSPRGTEPVDLMLSEEFDLSAQADEADNDEADNLEADNFDFEAQISGAPHQPGDEILAADDTPGPFGDNSDFGNTAAAWEEPDVAADPSPFTTPQSPVNKLLSEEDFSPFKAPDPATEAPAPASGEELSETDNFLEAEAFELEQQGFEAQGEELLTPEMDTEVSDTFTGNVAFGVEDEVLAESSFQEDALEADETFVDKDAAEPGLHPEDFPLFNHSEAENAPEPATLAEPVGEPMAEDAALNPPDAALPQANVPDIDTLELEENAPDDGEEGFSAAAEDASMTPVESFDPIEPLEELEPESIADDEFAQDNEGLEEELPDITVDGEFALEADDSWSEPAPVDPSLDSEVVSESDWSTPDQVDSDLIDDFVGDADDADDWADTDQSDATDDFINQVTHRDEAPISTSVSLSEADLENLDNRSEGGSMNWLVGLGLGVVVLGLLGVLFNALGGNMRRQPTDPVAETPVEVPVPADETEAPPAEPEAPEPAATEAEAPEPAAEDPAAAPIAEADYFREAVNAAQNAANLAQTASTGAEWQAVADSWAQAIDLMKQVPESDPDYATAQQKAVDYQPNLDYAQQNAERL